MRNGSAVSTLLAGIVLSGALGIQAPAQVPLHTGPGTATKPTRPAKKEPCWQVAGVSVSAMHERRAISRQARQEVESVCANSSRSAQQKHAQIQQIRERERQQINAIITPAQREAIRSCQESRGGGHGGGGGGGHFGGGPCGDISAGHKPIPHAHPMNEEEEDDLPASDLPKPN
jgi:hypothetical protein